MINVENTIVVESFDNTKLKIAKIIQRLVKKPLIRFKQSDKSFWEELIKYKIPVEESLMSVGFKLIVTDDYACIKSAYKELERNTYSTLNKLEFMIFAVLSVKYSIHIAEKGKGIDCEIKGCEFIDLLSREVFSNYSNADKQKYCSIKKVRGVLFSFMDRGFIRICETTGKLDFDCNMSDEEFNDSVITIYPCIEQMLPLEIVQKVFDSMIKKGLDE